MRRVIRKSIWLCLILAQNLTRDADSPENRIFISPASSPARACGAGAGIRNQQKIAATLRTANPAASNEASVAIYIYFIFCLICHVVSQRSCNFCNCLKNVHTSSELRQQIKQISTKRLVTFSLNDRHINNNLKVTVFANL